MSHSKLYNILGIPRWAKEVDGKLEVEETAHYNTRYMAYDTHTNHPILWDKLESPTVKDWDRITANL